MLKKLLSGSSVFLSIFILSSCVEFYNPHSYQYPQAMYRPRPKMSDLFGLSIKSMDDIKEFNITRYYYDESDDSYHVSYESSIDKEHGYAYAWGDYVKGVVFKIRIYNKFNHPIQINYFTNNFSLITTDGITYNLKNLDIQESDYINPNESLEFRLRVPESLQNYKLKEDDIQMILCELGITQKIILCVKVLPKTEYDFLPESSSEKIE